MTPGAGERLLRHVGDSIRFTLKVAEPSAEASTWHAFLRTNLGRGEAVRSEIIQAYTAQLPLAGASWRDIPLRPTGPGQWEIEFPLHEVGFFKAKAYAIDPQGCQHWPDGSDAGISVHPDACRTANIIYCAFTRLYGATRFKTQNADPTLEAHCREFDQRGFAVIPASGKLRDLAREVPHIMEKLGCRVLHLLPINPTPTTYARMGRYGSPYAAGDFIAIDPALVEFDRRTTAVDQFGELADAVHLRGGRLFLDLAINHTGWGSTYQNNHPEWFLRHADGAFASPGAWGTIWEDLVELRHDTPELWDALAEAFLTWCGRGVDGFRCDAGYKVPLPVWQYITARVRAVYPNTIFLLEGLGGAWEATENLLGEGGMQWAYSELFQNYSGKDVAWYLDYCLRQSQTRGLWVHYSETHDNARLAAMGRHWSLLRNRLCALTSVSGGFGYTGGVEWLAAEKVNVHQCAGLSWNNPANILPELAQLSQLLAGHPCFYDGARLTRLSAPDAPVFALRRDSAEGADHVLVLANTDCNQPFPARIPLSLWQEMNQPALDLLTGSTVAWEVKMEAQIPVKEILLKPAECLCLSRQAQPAGLAGNAYRAARAQAAFAIEVLAHTVPAEQIGTFSWLEMARLLENCGPEKFLAAVASLENASPQAPILNRLRHAIDHPPYRAVIVWSVADARRITPVPPGHWLLVEDSVPFRAALSFVGENHARHLESIRVGQSHFVAFPPRKESGAGRLALQRCGKEVTRLEARIRFLDPTPRMPQLDEPISLRDPALTCRSNPPAAEPAWDLAGVALLANGRGGMARLRVDFGSIQSKYDCLLGANLHAELPVDRHIFVKRARLWINADGFLSPLDGRNLECFCPGPPATWRFLANAGDGRCVEIQLQAFMLEGENTTILRFFRPKGPPPRGRELPAECIVRLTVRVDIEDRNFHSETQRNDGADFHFNSHTRGLSDGTGFRFQPAADRGLLVFSSTGLYHPQPEWCDHIAHPFEQTRGQTGAGSAFSPGWFELLLAKDACAVLAASAETTIPLERTLARGAIAPAPPQEPQPSPDRFELQLRRSARAFLARRGPGKTIIAGYPWFLDWGRDSLISARGLLAAGCHEEIQELLKTFARLVDRGTLPNCIHGDNLSNRDTSDAPLWFCLACREAAQYAGPKVYRLQTGPGDLTLAGAVREIVLGYLNGTPNGIRVDPDSGLVWSPSHFTWMDTNYPAATPREGYPVESQALWIHALRLLARLQEAGLCEPPPAQLLGAKTGWHELAATAEAAFNQYFWLEDRGYLADVLLARAGTSARDAQRDTALRSNGLLAVTLDLISGEKARRCVEAARRYLVVPGALRSLAPLPVAPPLPVYNNHGQLLNNPAEPYWGHYEGDEDTRRKPAYHNGTAWTWTFPIFCEALAKAWDFSPSAVAAARAYLGSMNRLLLEGCAGHIPEIIDGDAPHTQRGCDAQAWGATEALRVWELLNRKATEAS